MVKAEFEEREFETPLYNQLVVSNSRVWAPGQVLEGKIGFDYSAFVDDPYFWKLRAFTSPPSGFFLQEMVRSSRWKPRRENLSFPSFALNLFIQAKRPEHVKRISKKLSAKNLNSPYWRFNIENPQQMLLETLESKCKGKALVCYASPAFHRLTQLYAHTMDRTIIENSTFPDITVLKGHSAWNYNCGGATGVANIEPVYIEQSDINTRIESLVSEFSVRSRGEFESNLASLADNVTSAVRESDGIQDERKVYFFNITNSIDSRLRQASINRYENLEKNFLVVRAFIDTFNLQWFVLGDEKHA